MNVDRFFLSILTRSVSLACLLVRAFNLAAPSLAPSVPLLTRSVSLARSLHPSQDDRLTRSARSSARPSADSPLVPSTEIHDPWPGGVYIANICPVSGEDV